MLATRLELITIILLCVLLAEKELIRAYHGNYPQRRMRVLNIAIAPLLLAFGLIVTKNLASFLGLLK